MIVERSPTPVPLEERDPATLTREELEELVRRQREQAAVKQENARGTKRERSSTVLSTPARPLKSSKIGGKTVFHIDSSEDEEDPGATPDGEEDADGTDEEVEVVNLT